MTEKRGPLPFDPEMSDLRPAVRSALIAWGKGQMTPSQQKDVLAFICNDLACILVADSPSLTEREAGFTGGGRRIGIVLAKLTGARFVVPGQTEEDDA